jgi:hypothetical protein
VAGGYALAPTYRRVVRFPWQTYCLRYGTLPRSTAMSALFAPESDGFTPATNDLNTARDGHTATARCSLSEALSMCSVPPPAFTAWLQGRRTALLCFRPPNCFADEDLRFCATVSRSLQAAEELQIFELTLHTVPCRWPHCIDAARESPAESRYAPRSHRH